LDHWTHENPSISAMSSSPPSGAEEATLKADADAAEDVGKVRASRKDRRTLSDQVLFASLPEEVKHQKQRVPSSTDIIKTFSKLGMTMGDDDLRYAEEIAAVGTRRERMASGISDMVVKEKIEEDEDQDEFPYNEKGFTTEEAEALLAIHGKNSLPENVDPKWLIMFRILTQPMVRQWTYRIPSQSVALWDCSK